MLALGVNEAQLHDSYMPLCLLTSVMCEMDRVYKCYLAACSSGNVTTGRSDSQNHLQCDDCQGRGP